MQTTRRSFITGAAAAGAFNIVPARVLAAATAPSNQLTRALIGFGAIARNANHLPFKGSRLIGLCDPFDYRVRRGLAESARHGWGKVKAYKNFMELLDDKDVDIVHICTPSHWHGVQCVMAANAGKDIWCEKPMTRTVGEGKRVMEVVNARKRIFRLNTWFRFQSNFYGFGTPVKPVKQIVASGLLGNGPLTCVAGSGQGFSWSFGWSGCTSQGVEPVPAGFDYDMWLGPAPWKPYNKHRVGTSFRGYWDYDSGGFGDMAQHYLDALQYVLEKDDTSPVKIEYAGPWQNNETVGRFDRFTLTYADGTRMLLDGDGSLADAPLLLGTNGVGIYKRARGGKTLRIKDRNGWWSEKKVLAFLAGLPEPAAQNTDFIDCVRTRKKFTLNESNGFRSCSIFNLAIVAWRLGRGFEFDPVAIRAVDDPAADRFLYQQMRAPWQKELIG